MADLMPHEPYINSVIDALIAAGLEPTSWWASDAEIDPRGDGATTMDDAVLMWAGNDLAVNEDRFPDGVMLIWESSADTWQWAEMRPGGSNEEPEFLPLSLDAEPSDVVNAARAVLAGGPEQAGGEVSRG